jgi:hypothetical protein
VPSVVRFSGLVSGVCILVAATPRCVLCVYVLRKPRNNAGGEAVDFKSRRQGNGDRCLGMELPLEIMGAEPEAEKSILKNGKRKGKAISDFAFLFP